MPLDSGYDRFAGLDSAVRRMCETLLGLEHDFARAQEVINQSTETINDHQGIIDAARGGQDQLRVNARKLQDAALVMGYDLFKIMEQARQREAEREIGPPAPTAATGTITEPPPASFSVKQFVLEYVESKHPNFVAAASIEHKLKELGHDVHPKTVGMSLYRWSQKGFVRREGKAKWYFVPEDERQPILDAIKAENERACEAVSEALRHAAE